MEVFLPGPSFSRLTGISDRLIFTSVIWMPAVKAISFEARRFLHNFGGDLQPVRCRLALIWGRSLPNSDVRCFGWAATL